MKSCTLFYVPRALSFATSSCSAKQSYFLAKLISQVIQIFSKIHTSSQIYCTVGTVYCTVGTVYSRDSVQ